MPTTTNYGWTTPADTDLVKDGASAIRTLGTAIDTTVFNNAGAAIAKTIVDAKGDLIVGTAADTVARLAVGGTNGHVLTVNSGATNGVEWAALPPSGGMTLLDTVSISGSSTTSNTFSSSYKQILVYVSGLYASVESTLQIRLNGDTGGNYSWVLVDAYSGVAPDASTASSVIAVGYYGSSSTDLQKTNGIITITRPSDTTEVFVQSSFINRRASNILWSNGTGVYNNSAAITSITFRAPSGTFTAGTAYIYGVN